MDLRIISKNRLPVPYLGFRGGKFMTAQLLYPNIAQWVKMATPSVQDTIYIGQGSVAAPTDQEELNFWNLWKSGATVMTGRTDPAGMALIMDVAMEIWNLGPTDIAITTSTGVVTLLKKEIVTVLSVGGISLNEIAPAPPPEPDPEPEALIEETA